MIEVDNHNDALLRYIPAMRERQQGQQPDHRFLLIHLDSHGDMGMFDGPFPPNPRSIDAQAWHKRTEVGTWILTLVAAKPGR